VSVSNPAKAGRTLTEDSPGKLYDSDVLASEIIRRTDGDIRLALPLGLGKANSIANALTRAACRDRQIRLKILTALTLQRPRAGSELEKRLLEPAEDRLFGKYKPLLYAELIDAGELPDNIEVSEFFLQAGHWLGNDYAQRHYISANYTHAFQYLMEFSPNVVAQLVARDREGRFSLSCNTDISCDLLAERRNGRADFLLAVETNDNLPFMGRSALVDADEPDLVLEPRGEHFELFSVVRRPIGLQDLAIGLHTSRLVADGGTLQIGIGSIGDAIAQSLILRDRHNEAYRKIVENNPLAETLPEDHLTPFETGLYCVTEMLVGGLLELFEADIIRREVDGAAIHAGFFLDCRDVYRKLRDMPEDRRDKIAMMPVSFTNSLYGDETEKRRARQRARYVNNAMIATCLGAVVSDATEGGQVVSGIGGQFNFVEQAVELDGGRSILTLNATRESGGKTVSNIRWQCGHESVPRHFRDIFVTEYGVADLRGKTDEACIAAMLSIADSRFQQDLLKEAVRAGKIRPDYEIPKDQRHNLPETLRAWLTDTRRDGILPAFPFGTDFTSVEQRLLPALSHLKKAQSAPLQLIKLFLKGLRAGENDAACHARLDLNSRLSPKERILRFLVAGALAETADLE